MGHTCATSSKGEVYCWGLDYITNVAAKVPVPVSGIQGAVAVSAGYHYNCALLKSGSIVCWGDDGFGQLGNGSTVDSATPVQVTGINNAVAN